METENVYCNGRKTWVVGSLHSSFKEELLDEFLDEHDLQKFAENSKTKTIKENARNKIMLGIRTTPCTTQIHKISKMVIRHLWHNS